jgi:histidinol-phosphate aminotransferase
MTEQDVLGLVRKNILQLSPYSSARDEYQGKEAVFLDANENPFETGYNRYPDPRQLVLKQRISRIKGVAPSNIFLGNGSDEAIDLLVRAFCEPSKDNIIAPQPTYGMYEVSAAIQDVEVRKPLLNKDFTLNIDQILAVADKHSKLLFLCSPNNPTGNCHSKTDMEQLLKRFNGVVIVDEAYIDFAPEKSIMTELRNYPNLVVLQTFSKAWGLAGIRLGMAFGNKAIIEILNKVKPPYNVNILTQHAASEALTRRATAKKWLNTIIQQRDLLLNELRQIKLVEKVYPTDANFILIKVKEPKTVYDYLVKKGIVVRDRSKVALCEGCLRITVGLPDENQALLKALTNYA